ncbi:13278_t:CDS:2, partial [Racocetra persica]
VDQQLFLLSENAEFIKFLQELDPRYRLPCHQTLSTWANTIIELLKEMGIGQKLLEITTDNAANMLAMGRVLKEKMNNEFSNPNVQHFH